jgi:hypothetical protein
LERKEAMIQRSTGGGQNARAKTDGETPASITLGIAGYPIRL